MTAYIALGANTGRRDETMRAALRELSAAVGPLLACSRFVETRPVGFVSPHLFLNAVAAFDTALEPLALLEVTQAVERRLGRTQKSEGGVYRDRPIDLDLLLVDGVTLSHPRLTLPHPRLHERRFVLGPLAEIAPAVRHPLTGLTALEMLRALDDQATVAEADASADTLRALNALLPQLSATSRQLTEADLLRLTQHPSTRLYVLRDETGAPVATATLCLCASPTGTKAWLEDVVVDAACRGRGYGRRLVAHCRAEAARLGAACLMLTSRPSREAANALYVAMGFGRRETNVYRCPLLPSGR